MKVVTAVEKFGLDTAVEKFGLEIYDESAGIFSDGENVLFTPRSKNFYQEFTVDDDTSPEKLHKDYIAWCEFAEVELAKDKKFFLGIHSGFSMFNGYGIDKGVDTEENWRKEAIRDSWDFDNSDLLEVYWNSDIEKWDLV